MSEYMAQAARLQTASAALAALAGSDASAIFMDVLDELEEKYMNNLVDCEQNRVIPLQSQIKQLRALRKTVAGDAGSPAI